MWKWASLLLALAGSLGVTRASAAPCLVARTPSAVERILVVENVAEGSSAVWISVETLTEAGLAVLLDEPAGSAIEAGGDAFVAALDAQTAPFVMGVVDPYCRTQARPTPPRHRAPAETPLRVADAGSLSEVLGDASFDGCELSFPLVVLRFGSTSSAARTDVVRIVGPRRLSVRAGFPATLTFLTLGPGRAHWEDSIELWARDLLVEYDVATATNTYAQERERALRGSKAGTGAVRLIESVLPVWHRSLAPAAFSTDSFAEDIALALSGREPSQTWLTRSATWTRADHSRELVFEAAAPVEPALTPTLVDSSGCPPRVPAPTPYVPPPPAPPPVDDSVYIVNDDSTVYVVTDASCSGNASGSGDSCSGDSSSSGDDSCSGDSSSSSDDSCSGDSSSSGDDSCSGDSAGDADEDEACVKASAGAPARGNFRRSRRTRVSAWTLALAAVWLPLRRVRRGLGAAPASTPGSSLSRAASRAAKHETEEHGERRE